MGDTGSGDAPRAVGRQCAFVLFMDIVGYTLLPADQQSRRVRRLQELVRACSAYQAADAAGRLIKLPRGDGMALVFLRDDGDAIRCALEIGRALPEAPDLRLRLGIHVGEISLEQDMNGLTDVSGDGINLAHRAMEPGDHGHILMTAAVAEWLAQRRDAFPQPHDLGTIRAKHGMRMHLFNCYGEGFGNEDPPQFVVQQRLSQGAYVVARPPVLVRARAAARRLLVAVCWLALAAAAAIYGPDGLRWARLQWVSWRRPAVPAQARRPAVGEPSASAAHAALVRSRQTARPEPTGLAPPILPPTIRAYGPDGAPLPRGTATTQSDGGGEPILVEVRIQPKNDRRGRRTFTLWYKVDDEQQADLERRTAGPETDPATWRIHAAGGTLTLEGSAEVADGDVEPFGPVSFRLPPPLHREPDSTPE